jgi:hypothetical protein
LKINDQEMLQTSITGTSKPNAAGIVVANENGEVSLTFVKQSSHVPISEFAFWDTCNRILSFLSFGVKN